MEILVLGAGVIGLTTALALQEAGHRVKVIARELGEETTSGVAGAIWYPTHQEPTAITRAWSRRTLDVFLRLTGEKKSGVFFVRGRKLFCRRMGPPWWAALVPEFRLLGREEVPAGYRCGYAFRLPAADMAIYLGRYLPGRFLGAGGRIERREVRDWKTAAREFPIVVNATGLGAATLFDDKTLFSIRGEVLVLEGSGMTEALLSTDGPEGGIYCVPRTDGVILGGGAELGNVSPLPDPRAREEILRRAASLLPGITAARVRRHRVGLRPGRAQVRLERVALADGRALLHSYGHGRSGVTLSWGAADAASGLLRPPAPESSASSPSIA